MTAIIGLVCPREKKIFIGGDSAAIEGLNVQIRSDEKVFRNGPFIMGFTSSFRMGQLLRYSFNAPKHPKNINDMKFMINHFIPSIKECFIKGGYNKTENLVDSGGVFIVGYNGNIYEIESDYQVAKLSDNIVSVGCGSKIALGAMYALSDLSPRERIKKSLEITTYLNAGVRPPYIIEEL